MDTTCTPCPLSVAAIDLERIIRRLRRLMDYGHLRQSELHVSAAQDDEGWIDWTTSAEAHAGSVCLATDRRSLVDLLEMRTRVRRLQILAMLRASPISRQVMPKLISQSSLPDG